MRSYSWVDRLSARSANVLRSHYRDRTDESISKDQVIEDIRAGRIKPGGIIGLGEKTFNEICIYLGLREFPSDSIDTPKPERKNKTITVEYWSCLNKDHEHKTEETAQACIDKEIKFNEDLKSGYQVGDRIKNRNERMFNAIKMRSAGKSYKEIGDNLNVSVERARQIVFEGFRKLRHPDYKDHELHKYARDDFK